VLLLDEPFGALDSRVRKELRSWLRRLHDELGITSVFVTHDQEEALELADRVVVMNHGRIEQEGTPEQVYHEPATRFVTEFLGDVNVFHARVERGLARIEDARFRVDGLEGAERASIYVRPHRLEIHRRATRPEDLRARVLRLHAAGPTVKVSLELESGGLAQAEIPLELPEGLGLGRGVEVWVRPREKRVFVEDYEI
jgi:sulfate transport system ATP-binding protein